MTETEAEDEPEIDIEEILRTAAPVDYSFKEMTVLKGKRKIMYQIRKISRHKSLSKVGMSIKQQQNTTYQQLLTRYLEIFLW